jgi:ketosteroid isomerase-like protein
VVVRSAAARVPADSPTTQPQDPTVVESIMRFEQNIGEARVAFDVDKLNQTYADDWVTVGQAGDIFTKENLLFDFKSRKHKLVSFELGPMKVRVLGDVAMAQASVAEKKLQDGKDVSGEFVFMDLLEKRAGKWVVFRTLGARAN